MKADTFGRSANDFRLPADFDGDGVTDLAVWRGLQTGGDEGTWYWRASRDNSFHGARFGAGGPTVPPDFPTPGDFDGDGRSDLAIWRRIPREFHVAGSAAGYSVFNFGLSTDRLVSYELQVR